MFKISKIRNSRFVALLILRHFIPHSTIWRQPITFKLLRADWPPPRNRRSSWLRIYLSAPNSFVVKSNFSEAWVSSAEPSSISRFFNMAYKMAISA